MPTNYTWMCETDKKQRWKAIYRTSPPCSFLNSKRILPFLFFFFVVFFPRSLDFEIRHFENGSKGCLMRIKHHNKTERSCFFFFLGDDIYQSKYHCYSTPKSLAFLSGADRHVMFLMDSVGPPALAALPTCMISVAIECLSAVAPQVPTLWLLTRCARPAHQMPERTHLGRSSGSIRPGQSVRTTTAPALDLVSTSLS